VWKSKVTQTQRGFEFGFGCLALGRGRHPRTSVSGHGKGVGRPEESKDTLKRNAGDGVLLAGYVWNATVGPLVVDFR